MDVQRRAWEIVSIAKPGDRVSRAFDLTILSLILLNVAAVIVGSVQAVADRYGRALDVFETFSVVVFTAEYLARLWSCVLDPRYSRPIVGRARFVATPMAIVDLAAVLPFYLPFVGVDLRFVRVLRLMRVFRVAKVARYSTSLNLMGSVIRSKKEELVLTIVIMVLLIIMSSSIIYYCEHDAQPKAFPDIPTTMWWAVITLTTVGYGDVYPVTVLGRLFAALIAMFGIGMVALPTGIIGAGFVEVVGRQKAMPRRCPHCGKEID